MQGTVRELSPPQEPEPFCTGAAGAQPGAAADFESLIVPIAQPAWHLPLTDLPLKGRIFHKEAENDS